MDKQINELRFGRLFVENLEKTRTQLNMSQREMARRLDVSLSTYKRIINGDTGFKGLYTLGVLYSMTGKFACEFVEVHDKILDTAIRLKGLSENDLELINRIIDRLEK